jgi:membrane-associated phospholipid phosphatase
METIWNIGLTWIIFFQNQGSWLKTPMEVFSFFGTENFFLLLLPALYWCMEAGIGLRVGIILLMSTSVNDALKMAFHGPRPYWYSSDVIGFASETSFGVPSGHAQIAVGVWGMLAASIRKGWGWLIAILIILLIGISRIYLGVHFPHDVILGWLIGALLLWLVLHFWKPVTAWLKKMSLGQQILASFFRAHSVLPYPLPLVENHELATAASLGTICNGNHFPERCLHHGWDPVRPASRLCLVQPTGRV